MQLAKRTERASNVRRNELPRIHQSIINLWYIIAKDKVDGLGSLQSTSNSGSDWPPHTSREQMLHTIFPELRHQATPILKPAKGFKYLCYWWLKQLGKQKQNTWPFHEHANRLQLQSYACPDTVCQTYNLLQAISDSSFLHSLVLLWTENTWNCKVGTLLTTSQPFMLHSVLSNFYKIHW